MMLIDRYEIYLRAERRYSEHTVKGYIGDVERFVGFLQRESGVKDEQLDPQNISVDDAREWVVSLSEDGLSPRSINRMVSSLKSYYRWLRKVEKVQENPFGGITKLKESKYLPNYITESQMKVLIEILEQESESDDIIVQRDALIVLLFYSTGIRLAELLDIRLGDFSNKYRELRIRGKGGRERVVPIVDYTRQKIINHLTTLKEQNSCIWPPVFLFLTVEGEPINRAQAYKVVKAMLVRGGVQGKRSPHVLRHTFATHLLNDGADIREIQELLGHTSLAATQIYTHSSVAELKKIYAHAHPRSKGRTNKE